MARTKKNTVNQALVDTRRRQVAALRLRGLTIREIIAGMTDLKQDNPVTGRPWALSTIHKDLAEIQKDWKTLAAQDIGVRQARILAELDELRRMGWENEDGNMILKALEHERAIVGVDAPKQTHTKLTNDGKTPIFNVTVQGSKSDGD